MGLMRLIPKAANVPPPIAEATFLQLEPGTESQAYHSLGVHFQPAIFAAMVRLNAIFHDIVQSNKTSLQDTLSTSNSSRSTEALAEELYHWRSGLHEALADTGENLVRHAVLGTGGAFVALHSGYHYFALLLFYRFLHLRRSPRDNVSLEQQTFASYAARCQAHSSAVCDLIYHAYATPGAEVYVSTSILLRLRE